MDGWWDMKVVMKYRNSSRNMKGLAGNETESGGENFLNGFWIRTVMEMIPVPAQELKS